LRAVDESLFQIRSFEEKPELGLGQYYVVAVKGINPGERSLLKPLANEHKPCAIVIQALAACTASVDE
jgi:hypothetical protein